MFNDNGSYDIYTHKVSNKNNNLTYFENELGSQYCEVYCIEDLTASFAAPNVNVEAGSKFTWGYSTLEGSRTCKTKSVEWDRFEQDLRRINQEIVDNYAQMKAEEEANQVEWSEERDCDACCQHWVPVFDDCDTDGDGVNDDQCQVDEYCGSCGTRYEPSRSNITFTATATTNLGPFTGGGKVTLSANCSGPTYEDASPTPYLSAISEAKGYVEQMKKCYTWEADEVYTADPQATIIYSDDINYYYRDELDANTSYSFSDQSICVNDIAEPLTSCSGNTCQKTTNSMKNCSGDDRYVLMVRNSKTDFAVKENVFRYVLKSNHLSIHPNDLANYNIPNFTTNFIDIGYSNFPVSFSAVDGVYGTNEGRGQFDVEYSNLGHVETGRTMVDTILSSSDISNGTDGEFGKWICQYTVYSDLLPEDDPGKGNGGIGDIDLIYRPIDLYNPFPDIDASKRDTGSNWCDQNGDCSYDNTSVQTYIYNNRGVAYDEIYNEEPMYTFVLTPAIIKEIREYNDNNSYASYTGSLGTAQYFDYQCEEGTGIACISDYLSYLIDITGAKDRPGVCVDDQYRSYNDVTSFYNCRY